MQHPFLQKFLQNNEPWLPRALALVAAYLLARGLFLGVGGAFFVGLFCLASVLFGALLNAVYGRLPPCPLTEQSDWMKWNTSLMYLGNPGKTAVEHEAKAKITGKNAFYLCAAGFIVADIIDVFFSNLKIPDGTALETLFFWLFFLSTCFIGCSLSLRTNPRTTMPRGYFKFWLHTEVYWVKCLYLFLFSVGISAFLLSLALGEKSEEAYQALLYFFLLMLLPSLLMNYLSYYFLGRIGNRVSWARPFYMSLLFLVSVAMLFAIFMLEAPIAKVYAGMVFMLSSLVFVLCALYLVRGKK